MSVSNCAWISDIIDGIWPVVRSFVTSQISEVVEPMLQDAMGLKHIRFENIFLGKKSVALDEIKVYSNRPDVVVIFANFSYQGSDVDVKVNVPGSAVQLMMLKVDGRVGILIAPLQPNTPFFGSLQFFLVDPPEVDFEVGGLKRKLAKIPKIARTIDKTVEDIVCSYGVAPNKILFKLVESRKSPFSTSLGCPQPECLLRIRVIEAAQMKPKEKRSSLHRWHPICTVAVGGERWQTEEGTIFQTNFSGEDNVAVTEGKQGFRQGIKKAVKGVCHDVKHLAQGSRGGYGESSVEETGISCYWRGEAHDFLVCSSTEQKVYVDIWDENEDQSALMGETSLSLAELNRCCKLKPTLPLQPHGSLALQAVWFDLVNDPLAASNGAVLSVVYKTAVREATRMSQPISKTETRTPATPNLVKMTIKAECEGVERITEVAEVIVGVSWEQQVFFIIKKPSEAVLKIKCKDPSKRVLCLVGSAQP